MLRFAALLTMFVATSPAIGEPRHFTGTQEGVSFDYTSELTSHGDVLLRGIYLNTHERFRFTVDRYGYVNGYVGDRAVGFEISQHDRDRAVAEIRADQPLELARR